MLSFNEKESRCQEAFNSGGPFWHLSTPGTNTRIIFKTSQDFVFAMMLMARCTLDIPNITILAFEIMNNHIHVICSGDKDAVESFFELFRRRLSRWLAKDCDNQNLGDFTCQLTPINTLKHLRNAIAYVHRNGYVVNPEYTPFSYPWGTGRYYFLTTRATSLFGDLSVLQQRKLCQCREICIPSSFGMIDGYVIPSAYCDITYGMSLFRDAWHYFNAITKNVESYAEFALELHDKAIITDEEMYGVATKLCKNSIGSDSIYRLDSAQRLTLAKKLHYDYNASNEQLRRILGYSSAEINSIFPLSAKEAK